MMIKMFKQHNKYLFYYNIIIFHIIVSLNNFYDIINYNFYFL